MELNRLRIPDGNHAGVQGSDSAGAVTNHGIGGFAEEPTVTAGGDQSSLGDIGAKLAGLEVSRHHAHTGFTVMNQGKDIHPIMHRHPIFGGLVIHGVQQGVARAI